MSGIEGQIVRFSRSKKSVDIVTIDGDVLGRSVVRAIRTQALTGVRVRVSCPFHSSLRRATLIDHSSCESDLK